MPTLCRFLLAFLIVIASLVRLPCALAKTEIIMGGDYAYPPYEFIDSHGNPSGFNVDLMRAIAETLDANLQVRLGLWSERVNALQAHEVNVLTLFYTTDRSQKFEFSIPFAIVNHSFFVRKNAPRIGSLKELKGRTVIVEAKSFVNDFFVKNEPDVHLILVSSESEALSLLSKGSYDAAVVSQAVGSNLKDKLGLTNIRSTGPPILPMKYCFAVAHGNKDLLDELNTGLISVHTSGRYDEIYAKWFLRSLSPLAQKSAQFAILGIAILLGILFLIIAWNRTLQSQVRLKTKELSQTLGERDRFISIASHELRTPLTPLRLQFQLFEKALERLKNGNISSLDQLLKYSKGMESQLERFTRLVNNVMDVATIRSGQLLWLRREKCRAGDVVRAVCERFRSDFENAKTPLSVHIHDNPVCFWDVSRIEQVLTNFLTNTLKYARGKPIDIDMKERDERVFIEIADHGPGMNSQTKSKIFEPFERGVAVSAAGLGLGLFIANQIVLSHSGTIQVESTIGKGTKFTIELCKF